MSCDFNPRSPHGERPATEEGTNRQAHFNPRSPHGERLSRRKTLDKPIRFQSTLPARGATRRAVQNKSPRQISIHAPRTGSDGNRRHHQARGGNFNPRSPHGERLFDVGQTPKKVISIHAPRTGSDVQYIRCCHDSTYFNPRSPHGERRESPAHGAGLHYFNPRSPHGERRHCLVPPTHLIYFNPRSPHGERRSRQCCHNGSAYFNPRSPHGERHISGTPYKQTSDISIHAPRTGSDIRLYFLRMRRHVISIHAPRTGSDTVRPPRRWTRKDFNPRSPHGERQNDQRWDHPKTSISIHAPRTGSDADGKQPNTVNSSFQSTLPARGATQLKAVNIQNRYFNPRSPHGERRQRGAQALSPAPFQSTLPARGATLHRLAFFFHLIISIHAPRTGSDCMILPGAIDGGDFNPRSPHGERPYSPPKNGGLKDISIHAPRTGSDDATPSASAARPAFQSTLPARGATCTTEDAAIMWGISIHAPRTGSDSTATRAYRTTTHFNPRSPHGERRSRPCKSAMRRHFNPRSPHGERRNPARHKRCAGHFNPRSPHGERHDGTDKRLMDELISIHAPRTGSDCTSAATPPRTPHFNPRSPHGERRRSYGSHTRGLHHFNPRSPHGERPHLVSCPAGIAGISIHAPRTGSDLR